MTRTVIRGGFILTMDHKLGEFPAGDILIEDDKIVSVGSKVEVDDAEYIDASNCIVLPGFVNAHHHLWQGALRGICADRSLLDYVLQVRMNAASAYTPDDMYAAQYHGALEALNAGTTTLADYSHNNNSPDHAHEAIRGIAEGGLRTVWSYGFNRPPLDKPVFRTQLERISFARELAKQYFDGSNSLLTLGISPEERAFWSKPETGDAQINLARELDARVFWHCNTPHSGMPNTRDRDVALLAERKLLGPDMSFVHMWATDLDEWEMVANSGASVIFTPETELQMGMMWPSLKTAQSLGINQGWGTDIVSNNSADMFTALRLGLQAVRCREIEDASEGDYMHGVPVTCMDALRFGTIESARAIGMDSLVGSLTPGKQADIIMIKTDTLSLTAWDRNNPAGTVLLQAQASDVSCVLVAGKIVKRDGCMLADVKAACSLLKSAHERISLKITEMGGSDISLEEATRRIEATFLTEDAKYDFSNL